MSILSQVLYPGGFVGLGDVADPGNFVGVINGTTLLTYGNSNIGGYLPRVVVSAEDNCFFTNPCVLLWTLVSGPLPPGVTLDPALGVQNGNPNATLTLGHGPGEFIVAVSNECGDTTQEIFSVSTTAQIVPDPVVCPSWTLGALWTVSVACSKSPNSFGLRRVADGITSTSDATNNTRANVIAGQVYFLEFAARGSGGANGTVSLGLRFYDSAGVEISEALVSSTGSPTDWATYFGNVTVPANASTAVAFFRAVGHTVGTWCVNFPFIARMDTNFVLSGLRHYYDDYTAYR